MHNLLELIQSKYGELYVVKDNDKAIQCQPTTKNAGMITDNDMSDQCVQSDLNMQQISEFNKEVFNLIKDFVILEDDLNQKIKTCKDTAVIYKEYLDLIIQRFRHAFNHF